MNRRTTPAHSVEQLERAPLHAVHADHGAAARHHVGAPDGQRAPCEDAPRQDGKSLGGGREGVAGDLCVAPRRKVFPGREPVAYPCEGSGHPVDVSHGHRVAGFTLDDEVGSAGDAGADDAWDTGCERLVDDQAPALAGARHQQAIRGREGRRQFRLVQKPCECHAHAEPLRFGAGRFAQRTVARHHEHGPWAQARDGPDGIERPLHILELPRKEHHEIDRRRSDRLPRRRSPAVRPQPRGGRRKSLVVDTVRRARDERLRNAERAESTDSRACRRSGIHRSGAASIAS